MSTLAHTFTGRLSTRAIGVALAFATALISGVSVYVNSKGVSHFDDATVYTTAKNAVAGLLLLALAVPVLAGPSTAVTTRPRARNQLLGLVTVAVIGGSISFVLFFEGLSRATATQAAFIHKTLVIWVALLAVPLLGERLGKAHYAAIGLLLAGQVALAGEAGTIAFGLGEMLILAATLMWAVEVIVVKRLLTSIDSRILGVGRMALGTAVLLGWCTVTGRLGDLFALTADQWSWALLTGLFLAGYVGTWYAALARAQAVDVTAVLVVGAVVTASIAHVADGAAFDPVGIALILAGAAIVTFAAVRAGTTQTAAL